MVIRLAVLDMAGTTVSDGGVVERSFVEALSGMGFDPDGAEMQTHLEFVRATMGQSKIVVFRAVFGGDEERAQDANRRFEAAFDGAVSRGEIEALPGAETALEAFRAARRAHLPHDRLLVRDAASSSWTCSAGATSSTSRSARATACAAVPTRT